MSRLAVGMAMLTLVVSLYTAGSIGLHPPTLSRAWGQGVVAAMRELDRRLVAVEREVGRRP